VADVDLASGAVTVRPLLATAAKGENGSARSATWLPSGLLAVTGYDARGRTFTPFGLRLLDLRTGALHALDATAEQVAASPGGTASHVCDRPALLRRRRAASDRAAAHPSGQLGAAPASG
jgi:hypothetical protein